MQAVPEQLKYPIGRYIVPQYHGLEKRIEWLNVLRSLPYWVDTYIENLTEEQLNTPYRENGWTIKQVVHHLADSHMNAYIRLKLALTEDKPSIKTYDENAWAAMQDYSLPISLSVTLLHVLHQRLVHLLESISDMDWQRSFYHPGHKRDFPVWDAVAMYAWHSRHHIEHIRQLRLKMEW